MIKNIIFDFDGVIHDTFNLVYPVAKQIHGFSTDEYRDLFNGNVYSHKSINEENSKIFLAMSVVAFKNLQIEKNIREELLKMKEDNDLYIVSSNTEQILNEYFENNGIIHIFKKVLGVETHRSKVEKFKLLFDKHGVEKDQSVFITDTLGDILEAKKVGLNTIAVDFGFHDRKRLEKGKPLKIVSDFGQILPEIVRIL